MAGAAVVGTRLPTARPPVRIFWEQCVQPWAVARARPALLHALAFVAPILTPLIAPLIAPTPTVVTVYDLSFFVTPERFPPAQRLYLRTFTGHSCRRARRVLAISESTRADVVRLLGVPPERVDLAYPGVDPAFRPLPAAEVADFRARLGLPARFVLYLGTLEPRKNLGTLLVAFAQLRAAQPDLHLVLAGGRGWWYADLFRQVQALGLEPVAHFPGYVPAADLPLWYNAAAAFAYPSAYEGFGMPVTEALACGCPVVTTTTSSLPEAGGDAAWRVPPADAPALAAALAQALLPDPARRARGLAHAARFTWDATAAQTAASYRRALRLPPLPA